MAELSTCVAGSWYDTVASIYNYKRKLLDVDYPVFFSSDGNYLHKFQFNPRTEVLLKIYSYKFHYAEVNLAHLDFEIVFIKESIFWFGGILHKFCKTQQAYEKV